MKPAIDIASVSAGIARPPARQIEEEADHRREHAERQQKQPEIVGRMADERDVVGQLRLGRVEERRREQAGKGDQHDPLPDPAERRGPRVFAADLKRRDRDQEREHAESQITSENTTWMTRPL